jgi:hypothetical protein
LALIIKENESGFYFRNLDFGDFLNLIDKEQGRIIVVVQDHPIEFRGCANRSNHRGASEIRGCFVGKSGHKETHAATLTRDIHLDVLSSDEYAKPLHGITSLAAQCLNSPACAALREGPVE